MKHEKDSKGLTEEELISASVKTYRTFLNDKLRKQPVAINPGPSPASQEALIRVLEERLEAQLAEREGEADAGALKKQLREAVTLHLAKAKARTEAVGEGDAASEEEI